MTAKLFKDRFQDLMEQAFAESPAPVSQMILELSLANARCIQIQLHFEDQKRQMESAGKIIQCGKIDLKGN